MGKTLKERLSKLPAGRRAKIEARADELLAEEMSLKDLRKARELTQEHMAELLGIGQEGISRIEKRSDLLISTLRNYLARMGGQLELVVRFRDRPAVLLQDLAELDTAAPKSPAPKKKPQRASPRSAHP
jgi:DNA-binding XRE family transcriptional regulator